MDNIMKKEKINWGKEWWPMFIPLGLTGSLIIYTIIISIIK